MSSGEFKPLAITVFPVPLVFTRFTVPVFTWLKIILVGLPKIRLSGVFSPPTRVVSVFVVTSTC